MIQLKQTVVPGSLKAQGSLLLDIKINPQSIFFEYLLSFLFLPFVSNQTHNY
jgi:hypothetical protein